jgi:signal transduction histidine kinase
MRWAATGENMDRTLMRLQARWREARVDASQIARIAAVLYLAGLGVVMTTAWHAPDGAEGGLVADLGSWHLAFLMMAGATVALLTLTGREVSEAQGAAGEPACATPNRISELMAQMSHELRTPLNAVIGFSDVMLRELHGPLGNVRYQEYAHHISESGGRLLKCSEEALAVTEAMTALMADRRRGRRGRMSAAAMVREAWRDAEGDNGNDKRRLTLSIPSPFEILCERRPTVQALEHLFREVVAHMPSDGVVEVVGTRHAGGRRLEIRTAPPQTAAGPHTGLNPCGEPNRGGLRVILARLLLEVQGATLACEPRDGGAWCVAIEFPGKG